MVVRGATLASRLVLVHATVGRREERLIRLAVLRKHRRAHADPELQPLARSRLEEDVVDGLLQLLTLVLGFVRAATREDDDELVASVADSDVVGADRGAEHTGDFAERAVADVVAVVVVDFLEVVEVHDHQRDL